MDATDARSEGRRIRWSVSSWSCWNESEASLEDEEEEEEVGRMLVGDDDSSACRRVGRYQAGLPMRARIEAVEMLPMD